MRLTMSKKSFLAINLLAEYMIKADITVEHAEGQHNIMLACLSAKNSRSAVVAEYSDVFQLMIHFVHHADATDN